MSIYCMSDIHGYFEEFKKMLSLIDFQESDKLYILGDIIDRGPASAAMLWWAMKKAPENVHFLLGNHEDMMLAAASNYYHRDSIELRKNDSWSYNYGFETIRQIRNFEKYYGGWEKEILDWIDCLPLYYDIKVDKKRFILVHAGLQSEKKYPDDQCYEGKNFIINIENLPTPQESQAMLWNRISWLTDKYEWPFDIICGHTPVLNVEWDLFKEFNIPFKQNAEGGIVHFGQGLRKHLIDCGVNRGNKLACLRLDDMQEFYVKSLIDD